MGRQPGLWLAVKKMSEMIGTATAGDHSLSVIVACWMLPFPPRAAPVLGVSEIFVRLGKVVHEVDTREVANMLFSVFM